MSAVTYKVVDGVDLQLHVWRPSRWRPGDRLPTVVFYHGGGWRGGSWTALRPQAEYLAVRGLVTISVSYRTQGPVLATLDAIDAMNYVFDHADDLGVDHRTIIAAGGSAGGHLALATALLTVGNADDNHRPAGLALLNPVTNTVDPYPDGWGSGRFADEQEAYEHSPYHHVTPGTPPTVLMHGTGDTLVNFRGSQRLAEKLLGVGTPATLIAFEGRPHGFFNPKADFYNDDFYETTRQLDLFLQSQGLLRPAQHIRPDPPQLVRNAGFEHDLAHWSAGPDAAVRLVDRPVHSGRQAASVTSGGSAPPTLQQDLTDALGEHGPGDYLLSAWLVLLGVAKPGSAVLSLEVQGSQDDQARVFTLAGPVAGHFTRVAGTTRVSWSGQLRLARLSVRSDSGQALVVDDVRAEFLSAQIGWWRFDDQARPSADSSGFERHGTVTGASFVPETATSGYLDFDGAALVTLSGVDNSGQRPFSALAWVRPAADSSADQVILAQGDVWLYRDGATGCLGTLLTGSRLTAPTPIVAGRWTSVGIVWDGERVHLFVDGHLVTSAAGDVRSQLTHLTVGGPASPDTGMDGWTGAIDDVRVWGHPVDVERLAAARRRQDTGRSAPLSTR